MEKLMNRKFRYGFIGFGRFAENTILPAVLESHNSEVIAVQNRDIDRAKESQKRKNGKISDTIIEDIEVPCICEK